MRLMHPLRSERCSFYGNHNVFEKRFCNDLKRQKPGLTVCALKDKGRNVLASDIIVKSPVGEGSYGQVFEVWRIH